VPSVSPFKAVEKCDIERGRNHLNPTPLRLTKEVVDKARPKNERFVLWDDKLPGFGLRVEPTGTKTFFLRYRAKGAGRQGAKRFFKIGNMGAMTPDEARNRARQVLGEIAGGADPAARIAKEKEALTVAALAERYLEDEVAPKLKKGTARLYSRYFRSLVAPKIGRIKAQALSPDDVAALHRKIGKTRPVTANRVKSAIHALFAYGVQQRLIPAATINPASGIKKFRETARERFLNTEELERLGAALREAETVGVPWDVDETRPTAKHIPKGQRLTWISPFAAAAIRLLLFTGCRLSEILHLEWRAVDMERGMLHLADSKTGKKAVILNAPALAVLADLKRISDFVIAGDDPTKPRSDLRRPWAVVRNRAGLEGLRIHDLRHSFASVGAGAGLGLPIVGRLFGHASPTTTARYAHLDADPLRRAANTIGATIAAAMDKKDVGYVVKLEAPHRARAGKPSGL
jgi:integrase